MLAPSFTAEELARTFGIARTPAHRGRASLRASPRMPFQSDGRHPGRRSEDSALPGRGDSNRSVLTKSAGEIGHLTSNKSISALLPEFTQINKSGGQPPSIRRVPDSPVQHPAAGASP